MVSEIPTIDFSPFLTGSSHDSCQTASEVDIALRSVGFFYLLNHGIDQDRIDTFFEWNRRFSSLPEHVKEKLRPDAQTDNGGYLGVGKESVRGQPCAKESFSFKRPWDDTAGSWPDDEQMAGFRTFAANFHEACTRLVNKLLECLSTALGLDPSFSLRHYHSDSTFVTSLIHYPAISTQRLRSGEAVRIPAHSDSGTVTLLFQQHDAGGGGGGLEMADMGSTDKMMTAAVERTAKFIHVDPRPGAIVVNVGYLMMRWTNKRWKNTVHRVVEPPRSKETLTANERDKGGEEMTPESCCDGVMKKWGPINAGEWTRKKRVEAYS